MINKNFGKLTGAYPQCLILPVQLTTNITIKGIVHSAGSWLSTDDEGAILELGYKPIIRTESPVKEGYYYTEKWTETETAIVQEWEEHEQPVEENLEEVIDILTGEVE